MGKGEKWSGDDGGEERKVEEVTERIDKRK